jgi:general secretion pathway protein A
MLAHFNLKDNPFRLTPETTYLFMGRHHEEAMAHLRYALAEGEGFTALTGERGVGKTTLCQAFIEKIGESASVAFITEPVPGPRELMRRICRQYGLAPTAPQTLKSMIDALNAFLMRQRLAGRKVALIIDDAQHLPVEVLEQVRLISNLETTREKLIQIVIVGEPELTERLGAHELRQMRQRISVSCEIGPLTAEETAAYIQHHMSRASKGPPARFEPEAVQQIFLYSGGNPRRINMACEALLTAAFRAGSQELTAAIAQEVLRTLDAGRRAASGAEGPAGRKRLVRILAAGAALALAAAAFVAFRPDRGTPPAATVEAPPEAAAPSVPEPPPAAAPAADPVPAKVPEPPAPPAAPAGGEGRKDIATARTSPVPPQRAYSVQTGAYLVPENAEQQAVALRAKGYPAQILKITDSRGRTWHTVRIGDHASRQAALAQAEEFNRREQARSIVRPYGAF